MTRATRELFRRADDWSRRSFLSRAAAGLLGVTAMPGLARAGLLGGDERPIRLQPASARHVIYLYLGGGMSHVDTFDPKPGTEAQGPTQAIPTSADGVRIGHWFPQLAQQLHHATIIRSMRSTQGAHAQGVYHLHTSQIMRGTIRHPSLGAWAERMAGRLHPSLPGHVVVNGSQLMGHAGFFGASYLPLPIGEPSAGLQDSAVPEHVDESTWLRRLERLEQMNAAFVAEHDAPAVRDRAEVFDQALALLDSDDLQAFELEREPEGMRAAYGEDRFGQGCLLARRLVEHGVRWVEVATGGWDMHSDLEDRLEETCPPVDQAVAALLADLASRGLLEDTLVVLATEFGRTPIVRADRAGRDHHPQAFSTLLAGGGIAGGRVHGETDELGSEVVGASVRPSDLNATIAHALGLPLAHELTSPAGRPFTVADDGRALESLFG